MALVTTQRLQRLAGRRAEQVGSLPPGLHQATSFSIRSRVSEHRIPVSAALDEGTRRNACDFCLRARAVPCRVAPQRTGHAARVIQELQHRAQALQQHLGAATAAEVAATAQLAAEQAARAAERAAAAARAEQLQAATSEVTTFSHLRIV